MATNTSAKKSPAVLKQQPLFDASAEPRAKPETWKLDAAPPSLGTLPREVYQAYCVLRAKGPCDAKKLQREISRVYDWDMMRILRVVGKLANCGYVSTTSDGVMSVIEERLLRTFANSKVEQPVKRKAVKVRTVDDEGRAVVEQRFIPQ